MPEIIVVLSSTNLSMPFNNLCKNILSCCYLALGSPCAAQQCAPAVCHLFPDATTTKSYRETGTFESNSWFWSSQFFPSEPMISSLSISLAQCSVDPPESSLNHCGRPMNKGPLCTNRIIFAREMAWRKLTVNTLNQSMGPASSWPVLSFCILHVSLSSARLSITSSISPQSIVVAFVFICNSLFSSFNHFYSVNIFVFLVWIVVTLSRLLLSPCFILHFLSLIQWCLFLFN